MLKFFCIISLTNLSSSLNLEIIITVVNCGEIIKVIKDNHI